MTDDDDVEEINPFLTIGFDDEGGGDELETQEATRRRRRCPQDRGWGIPTFQEQCNGQNQFVLAGTTRDDEGVLLHLEHRKHSTGSDLWDAALVLAYALDRPGVLVEQQDETQQRNERSCKPRTILELGSGTGAVGLYCAKCLGASHVILTDLPDNLPLLERNRDANNLQKQVSITSLDWNQPESWWWCDSREKVENSTCTNDVSPSRPRRLDLIIGSDLFLPYAPDLLEALVETLWCLLKQQEELRRKSADDEPSCQALICYEERFEVSPFFEHAEREGLCVTRVPSQCLHPKYRDDEWIHVLRITLRVE